MIVSSTITSQSCVPMLQAHLHGVLPVHQAAFTSLQQSGLRWSNRLKQACAVCHSLNMVNKSVVAGVDMERALFKAVEARFLVRVTCPSCIAGTRMITDCLASLNWLIFSLFSMCTCTSRLCLGTATEV
jgi:hypothetical protein